MSIIDISMPLQTGMLAWPGDPPVEITVVSDVCCGDAATVRRLNMGSHTGTHVDAISHFLPGETTVDKMDLSVYIGPCWVVDISAHFQESNPNEINLDWIQPHWPTHKTFGTPKRVLIKANETAWFEKPFDTHFRHLTPKTAEWLVQQGVQLVGVDAPSVDGYYADNVPVHHILLNQKVHIVEGLNLLNVSTGWYDLICLPLKILEGDGAPARVVLKTLS